MANPTVNTRVNLIIKAAFLLGVSPRMLTYLVQKGDIERRAHGLASLFRPPLSDWKRRYSFLN